MIFYAYFYNNVDVCLFGKGQFGLSFEPSISTKRTCDNVTILVLLNIVTARFIECVWHFCFYSQWGYVRKVKIICSNIAFIVNGPFCWFSVDFINFSTLFECFELSVVVDEQWSRQSRFLVKSQNFLENEQISIHSALNQTEFNAFRNKLLWIGNRVLVFESIDLRIDSVTDELQPVSSKCIFVFVLS